MSKIKTCHLCLTRFSGRENTLPMHNGLFTVSVCGKCWKKHNKEKDV